jgi:hypothetical protein
MPFLSFQFNPPTRHAVASKTATAWPRKRQIIEVVSPCLSSSPCGETTRM